MNCRVARYRVQPPNTALQRTGGPAVLALRPLTAATFSRPALLTHGDQSDPTFALILDRLARALPHAEKRLLPGVGHRPQVSHPADYVQIIESFIRHSESERAERTRVL